MTEMTAQRSTNGIMNFNFNWFNVYVVQRLVDFDIKAIAFFGKITQNNGYYAVQHHSRSLLSVPIESR